MPTSKLQRFQFLLLLAQRVHDVGLGNWCFFHGDTSIKPCKALLKASPQKPEMAVL